MGDLFRHIRTITGSFDPWWTILAVPLWQEFIFRYLPYRILFLQFGHFWAVGIGSSIAFALIHWYFGKWFVLWAFAAGMVAWWVMVHYGYFPAVLLHAVINIIDLAVGWRYLISDIER